MTTNPPESKFPTKAILGILLAAVIALAAAFGVNLPDAPTALPEVPPVVAPVEPTTDAATEPVAPVDAVDAVSDVLADTDSAADTDAE